MQDSDKQIQELALAFAKFIPILAGTVGMKNTRFLTGNVKSVDEDNRTCVVEGIMDNDTITYNDVNLSMERNDGFIQIPAVDSTVLVAKTPDGETYVIHCSDIDKIICVIDGSNSYVFDSSGFVFNGGTLGGLVKLTPLVTKLNNVEARDNAIVAALTSLAAAMTATGATPVLGAALGTAITTAISAITTPLVITVNADLENTKIKQ